MRRLSPALNLAMACFAWSTVAYGIDCSPADRQAAESEYRRGLDAYRAGRVDESLPALRAAHERCPQQTRFRDDFMVAAVAAGHQAEALELGANLPMSSLPPYVLIALGRAARDRHQADLAVRYFDAGLRTGPDAGASVGRDLALIDRGDARQAQSDLLALRLQYGDRVDVLEALGLADEALDEVVPALAVAEALLNIDPQHEGALALRYRMLVRSGAPQLAVDVTPDRLVTRAQRGATLHEALALEFRWARDQPGSDKARAERLDAVILRMRAAAADTSLDAEARAGSRRDLVEALAERGRDREAIGEYEGLLRDAVPVPPYVAAAAVGAYLTDRQPRRAAGLFQSLPADYSPSFGARVNYFYALLESGRYDEAVSWADRLAAQTPTHLEAGSPSLREPNGDYAGALVLAALARSYTDRPATAQKRLDAILDLAPADNEALLALAETEALRGWPRRARETASQVAASDTDAPGPWAKIYYDDLQMGDWRAAAAALARIAAEAPADDASLLREERDWQTHEFSELSVDAQFGRSYGGRPGVIDSTVEEYAYTPPLDWNYRAFVHLNQAEGTPIQGDTYRHAVGVGVEYHTADWLGTAELIDIDHGDVAPQLGLTATPDDQWKIGGAYALRTLDLPIAASVVGVHADKAALNADFRTNESEEFGATATHERFSDGNSRYEVLGFWRERWVTGPLYKLDTRVDLDSSFNTLIDTNYFNPRSDFTATITLQNQWLQYRRYDRALTHELDLGAGDYWQRAEGSGLVALLRYQLVFDINDRLSLKAGVGRTLRPYDGERERLDVLNCNFLGRF